MSRNPWDDLTDAEANRRRLAAELRQAESDVRAAARVLHERYRESYDSIASALGIHRQTAYERFRRPAAVSSSMSPAKPVDPGS